MSERDQLIATMAFAMQVAQLALENSPRNDSLEAALSSLTIALDMEAEHWQRSARRSFTTEQLDKLQFGRDLHTRSRS